VTGEHDAVGAAEVGAGDHRVADPGHGQPRHTDEGVGDRGGDAILVAGDRLDVHQFPGQLDRIVKGTHATTLSAFL
jgi:hypothetical protein